MISKEKITSVFVSQKRGNDENNGFYQETPLKSIEAAIALVAEARTLGAGQPIKIRILDEEYFIDKPVVIDGRVRDIVIEPFSKTKISGGMRLDGFEPDTFNGVPCLSVTLPEVKAGDLWFTDLYVNGVAAAFTSYPENDFLYAKEVENNGTELYAHSKWFVAEKENLEVIKEFRNFGDCFISFRHYWVDEHTPIESYDTETGKIVFKYASRFTIEPLHEASKLRYKIENVAEAFKNPGECYMDRPTGEVYYIPREGETLENISVYAPITDKLFIFEGTKDKKVCSVTLRNFDLNCTKGDYRSQYVPVDIENDIYKFDETFEGYASDIQSVCWGHGSIEMSYAHGCSIENCRMINMGVHAINIGHGCEKIYITDNEIRETGGGGIKIDGGELENPEHTHTHNVYVRNNYITRCGNRYLAACGILIKQAYECEVSHNEISWLYYTGISCGWTWRYRASVNRDNIIEKNYVHHLGQGKLSDMGGIYLLSVQPGTVVRGNIIHDVKSMHYGGNGIYLDEGSSYQVVENNICYNVTSRCYTQHYGINNTLRNNIFISDGGAPVGLGRGEDHVSVYAENNILISKNSPFFSINRVLDENNNRLADITGAHIFSAKNLMFDVENEAPDFLEYSDGVTCVPYTFEKARGEIGLDDGSIVQDPMFVDSEGRNFAFKTDSPALELGFKPIDVSDVGVIKK